MTAAHQLYQYKPFRGSSHEWAQKYLANLSKDSKVLDVGPGNGFAGKFLAKNGLTKLYAVEIDPDTRVALQNTYQKLVPSLYDLQGQKFDVVILLDVLEHMPNPTEFLKDLRSYLTPNAKLLISVPNVAHWSVRFQLLFGAFNYKKRGILDRSHLQLFTKRSILKLIKQNGFKILSTSQSIVPLQLVLPEKVYKNHVFNYFSNTRAFIASIFPGLCAFQLLTLAQLDHPQAPEN